jgi:phosphatidylglycerophosphatase A
MGDSPHIVIDEVAGFLLTTVSIPFTWLALVSGFFLFRFFDILKPPPIKWIERRLTGGMGVVLDDLVAAAYAHIVLRVVLQLAI